MCTRAPCAFVFLVATLGLSGTRWLLKHSVGFHDYMRPPVAQSHDVRHHHYQQARFCRHFCSGTSTRKATTSPLSAFYALSTHASIHIHRGNPCKLDLKIHHHRRQPAAAIRDEDVKRKPPAERDVAHKTVAKMSSKKKEAEYHFVIK